MQTEFVLIQLDVKIGELKINNIFSVFFQFKFAGNAHTFSNTFDSTVLSLNNSTANSTTNRPANQIGDNATNNEQDSNVPILPLNCEVR